MQIGFTKKAEEALELAAEAASELGHTSVGTEHILLGLLRQEDCVASEVLIENGADEDSGNLRAAHLTGQQCECC